MDRPTVYEATILGSLKREQAFGGMLSNGKSCWYGALLDGIGLNLARVNNRLNNLSKAEPNIQRVLMHKCSDASLYLVQGIYSCPLCSEPVRGDQTFLGVHLNDDHKRSRPWIAEYLRKLVYKETDEPRTNEQAVHVVETVASPKG